MDSTFTLIVSIVAVVVVAGILFAGLWNMFKGGEGSGNRSQMLMRARVIAQFVAIVVILGALFFFGRGAPPA
jgi:FtsH-binding integral membrane protein